MKRVIKHKIEIEKDLILVLDLEIKCVKLGSYWYLQLKYKGKDLETQFGVHRPSSDTRAFVLGKNEDLENYNEKIEKKIGRFKDYYTEHLRCVFN